MSDAIVAVLVVPAAGDPGGLLAWANLRIEPGPAIHTSAAAPPWVALEGVPRALPLWWDGALVPEGWDRARRVPVPPFGPWAVDPTCALHAELLGRRLVTAGLASRVVRLARVDGRLVEVEP